MNLKYTFVLYILMLGSTIAKAQSSNSRFVQFMLTNIKNKEKAIEIDQFMRTQDGVEISRADFVSKKYFCIYTPSPTLNKSAFETWMNELGIKIKCYREGKYGPDKIIDQKMDCE